MLDGISTNVIYSYPDKDMRNEKRNIYRILKEYPVAIETVVSISAITFLVYTMRSLLILGERTLTHDNLLWNYPIFQFFAENIINGHFPLWNPFSHAGEPFYPILGQVKLLEPITLLTIYLGHFISNDIVLLFNWNHFIKSLIMVIGVYIVFRPLAANLFIRLSLIPILLYSSFMLGSFREDFTMQFLWIPFITYLLLRIVYYKDYRWHNWFILAGLIGLNWQSYFFTGTWIFLLFFSLGLVFFRRDLLISLFKAKMIVLKFVVAACIIIAMAMPNIVLLLERDKYVFPARMLDTSNERKAPQGMPQQYEGEALISASSYSIKMPYNFIAGTGTFSTVWDFIQLISPDGNKFIEWPDMKRWGKPSEGYIYLGLLPWAIALLGIVAGKHDLKRLWLLILLFFGLLMLGPPGGLHRLLYYIYPPMWAVRHTHTFVSFFVFAFLYFYTLGFNHIFSTCGGRVFPPFNSHGNLSSFIKNNRNCKVVTFLVFSVFVVASVCLMTRMKYPVTNYLFSFIVLIFAVGWLLKKDLGGKGLYASLIVSHIAIVLILSRNTLHFISYIIPVVGLPISLFIFIKLRSNLSQRLQRYAPLILLSVFGASLVSDLVYSLKKSSSLYQSEKHPDITLNINTTPQKPFLPRNRLIEPHSYAAYSEQGVRYLSLAYRQPFVFFPLMEPEYSASYVHVNKIFNGLTNKSFENWVASPDGSFLPEQFTYHQDGKRGAAKKNTGIKGIKEGKASVLLTPSTKHNSYIKYQTSQIKELRGQYMRLSLWIKSQNKSGGAIKAEVQVDDGPVASEFYNNSGDWENLIIGKYIDKNATKLTITCKLKSSSTAPTYLDGFDIEIVEIKPDFESVLKDKRWSSFLLPKKYFELIHTDIPIPALVEMFAVDKPIFQFKQGIVQIEENEISAFLSQLGSMKSVKLLQDATIIVDEKLKPSLIKLRRSAEEHENRNQAVSFEDFNEPGSISGVKREREFAYTIERYEYDSCDIKVSTDKDGILYWADGYDKGWHAYVNRKAVPIYRANINFKAIAIPKGTSYINFIYNPFLFKVGLFVFYGTFIVCILAVLIIISFYNMKSGEDSS